MAESLWHTEDASTRQQELFMSLLDPVHDNLARFIRGMTRDRDEARDLMSETLLVAWESFGTLRSHDAFLSYLFTIARRTCRHRARHSRFFSDYNESEAAALPAVTSSPDSAADIPALYAALDRLSSEQREAVVLFQLSGLSLEEIREIQGGTLSGVKARVARGRRRLAKLLGVDETKRPEPHGSTTQSNSGRTEHGDETTFLHFSTAKS